MESMIPAIIDAVLIFALSIPIVMQYRIYPMEGTPYRLFGVLFLTLLVHVIISYSPGVLGLWKKHLERIKNIVLVGTLCIVLGGSSLTAIADRARVAPVWGVHDIILQQEAAMRYVLVGKNPYQETYFGTPVESFNYDEPGDTGAVNPALYHFVMPPWYLVFPFAFYYTVRPVVGFFDGRMALVFTMIMLLVAVWIWFRDKRLARVAVILTALSPSVVPYFLEGRSDIFALSWAMVSFVFLEKKKYMWSVVCMVLSLLSKQTMWFMAPFYIAYLWRSTAKHRQLFWNAAGIGVLVGGVITLPFMLPNPQAFFDSIVFYLSGNAPHSYPVSGYGLGMVLYNAGIINNIHAYYPFVLWQVVICIPLFIVLVRWLWHKPTQSKLLMVYAVFLMVYWYLSRYFNNSHLGFLSMLFVLAGLKHTDEEAAPK